MRYIRTKGGIYRKNIFPNKETSIKEWESIGFKVCAQADTIKELCDEFVCENSLIDSSPRKENGQIIGRYQKIDNAIMLAKKGLVVYGAIWTDKGLIYVAKMNSKGELELL